MTVMTKGSCAASDLISASRIPATLFVPIHSRPLFLPLHYVHHQDQGLAVSIWASCNCIVGTLYRDHRGLLDLSYGAQTRSEVVQLEGKRNVKMHYVPARNQPRTKVNRKGYLYPRPPLQDPKNAPTFLHAWGNILGYRSFSGGWIVEIGCHYKFTFLMCPQRPPGPLIHSRSCALLSI